MTNSKQIPADDSKETGHPSAGNPSEILREVPILSPEIESLFEGIEKAEWSPKLYLKK